MKKTILLVVCIGFSLNIFSQEYFNLTNSNSNNNNNISHLGNITLGSLYNSINDRWRPVEGRLLELYKSTGNVSFRVGNDFGRFSIAISGQNGAFFPNAKTGNIILRKQSTDRVIFSLNTNNSDGKHSFVFGDDVNKNTLTILNNGKVGIGTATPQETLHLNGSIRGNIGTGALRVKSSTGYLDIGSLNTSWAHIYTDRPKIIFNRDIHTTTNAFSSYNNDLILKTIGTERLKIKSSNGFVGIGTSSPDSKLTVKGKIHCEEVLVDLEVPADYVFQKYYTGSSNLKEDYTIPTLEEVEAFTKENHHLPNIPSAKNIQEGGLQLKEMTNLLLQKIEELTLYTIEQEKRIKTLEAQIQTTKKKK